MIAHISNFYHVTVRIAQVRLVNFWALIILISLRRTLFVSSENLASPPIETIFLDCGSSSEQSQSYKGRNWSSDIGSQFTGSNSDSNSTLSNASKGTTVPEVPYMTARLFYSKYSYTFNVTPGPKFIRLYFYSDSYGGLNASESFLTVTTGHYTLLRNFSCYLTAKYLKVDYFFKEFIIHVENHTLELIFTPTSDAPNAYGFVNGIEIVSMPLHLYIRGNDVLLPFVGFHPNMLTFGNDSALEMVYRANVGGQTISPDRDTGMFRTWNADETYIFGAAFGQLDYDITLQIQYPKTTPAYTVPGDVYRTARSMGQYNEINKNYNLSWFFPVDTGFKYLIRLHFCEIVPGMTLKNQRVFFIFINNQTAESQADVIVWSKGHGFPVYRDYVVMIPPQAVGKQDLWLELHPNIQVKPQYYDAILNGVEIFKISNFDGNLAGLNPPIGESNFQPTPSKKSKKGLPKEIKYSISGAFVLFVFFLFALVLIKTKRNWMMKNTKDSSRYRSFPINDIRKATNNFDDSLVIDKWGLGKVYKGFINGIAPAVAIKRGGKAISEQGFSEEIKMLSQIRHHNIISLLGYCQEDFETILVYEYMDNGSLSDHLHHHLEERKKPLSWNQRLEICVGIARGLHYLHTGRKRPIIHCDINTSNILLDKNWTAKISNFGSTMTSHNSNGSSMDGSIGSLDLDRDKTEKTDVYLFGLVLLEVLSGRPAPTNLKEENDENVGSGDDLECLIPPISYCLEKGDVDQLVDQHLKGKILPESLRNFVKITKQCLAKIGVKRPSMNESAYFPLENILLDCGSLASQANSFDGRNWTTDIRSHFLASNSDSSFTVSRASSVETSVPEVPYITARIFHSQFNYTLNVTPGPIFILHFYADSYMSLNASKSFLSVTAGQYTLLRNFSAYLTANYINSAYFLNEFVVHVENHTLDRTFSPSINASDGYAFVNGIEVVSMPMNLYNQGNNVSGNSTAMETMYRVNVGGQSIHPNQDSGMSRSWTTDFSYLFGAAFGVKNYGLDVPITYPPEVPAYTAPEGVYNTARSMGSSSEINKNYNLSWSFPVDSGFMYLVRLHFCEIDQKITKVNQRVFDIFINNQIVERGLDVIALRQGNGIPLYRDYTVLSPKPTFLGKQDLWLELHPNPQTKPQYYDAILNGVEIFKVSNNDRNLAGLNPALNNESSIHGDEPSFSSRSSKSSKKEILIIAGSLLIVVLALSLCIYLVAFPLKRNIERTRKNTRNSFRYRSFSISEIKTATDNFGEAKLIERGAFGLVYKGYIDQGSTAVNINRVTRAISKQELLKFEAEIRMHSHIRHQNIVPLIGYCKEDREMILIYEYMPNGTLFEHLHFADQRQKSPLSWNQRLEICAGAARGLHYLHYAMAYPIIHGDIKTTNIFLYKSWKAKISEKLDVFSFGVVLLEVLSGRQAMNPKAAGDKETNAADANRHESLVQWALTCLGESKVDPLVDRHLEGKIIPASLTKFMEITQKCLADQGVNRPSMIEVLCSLELAQQLQFQGLENSNRSAKDMVLNSNSNLMLGLEFFGVGR
ncbi:hypothetical protein CRYUN_Cryun29cG0089100 [Craigia yunnanensis]